MKKSELQKAVDFFKNKNNLLLVLILIIGVFLMRSISGGEDKKEVSATLNTQEQKRQLEDILSHIDGAGKVEVMITYYGGTEQSLAYEMKSENEEKSSEVDKRAVMSGNNPVIVQELYPEVKGVVVVAQGAGAAEVKRALSEAVSAALGIGVSKVRVYKSAFD